MEESDLADLADYLTGKRSLTPISDDVIKICRDRLDLPEWTSSPAPGLPPDQPNLNERNKGGWGAVIRDLPYKLPNINWDNTFWRATNNSRTMHTLGLKREDRAQEIAMFWVTGLIQYANLKYGTYES